MAREDLLVNIELDADDAHDGIDELTKTVSKNDKQTKLLNKVLDELRNNLREAAKISEISRKSLEKMGKDSTRGMSGISQAADGVSSALKAISNTSITTATRMSRLRRATDEVTDGLGSAYRAAADFTRQINTLTDPALLNRVSKLGKMLSLLFAVKGNFGISKAIFDSMRSIDAFSEKMAALRSDMTFVEIANRAGLLRAAINTLPGPVRVVAKSFLFMANAAGAAKGALESVGTAINSTVAALQNVLFTVSNLMSLLNALSDPERIKKLASLLKVIGAIFLVKGYGKFSEDIFKAADSLEDFAVKLEDFKGTPIEELAEKSDLLRKAMAAVDSATAAAAASAAGFVGLGLFRSFEEIVPSSKRAAMSIEALIASLSRASKSPELIKRSFAAGFTRAANDVRNFAAETGKVGLSAAKLATPGMLTLTEAAVVLGPVFLALSKAAATSEDGFIRFAGILSGSAAIALFGFSAAITLATAAIGGLIESMGDKLIGMMTAFEAAAAKSQSTLAMFTFVLKGFARETSEAAVGSIKQWSALIDEINKGSTFGIDSLRKSVKLLIAEGQALGLGLQDNMALLKRAADIAAATGNEIEDVTVRLIKGIAGNSQALIELGINVTDAALAHSKFAEEEGLVISQLDEHMKQQLRLNEIFRQTTPLIGAAANELDTIEGVNKKYEESVSKLQQTLGEQGVVTITYVKTLTRLLTVFTQLPKPIVDTAGVVLDAGGVFLKISGILIKFSITIASIATLFKILSPIVASNIALQKLLTAAFAYTAMGVGAQTVAVTSLNAALLNMALIVRGAFLVMLKTLGALLVTVAGKVAILTRAIVLNPLFLKAAFIASTLYLVVAAFQELKKEMEELRPVSEDITDNVAESVGIFDRLRSSLAAIGSMATSVFKLILVGLFKLAALTEVAALGFRMMFASMSGNEQKFYALNAQFGESLERLGDLDDLAAKAFSEVLNGFGSTVQAAESSQVAIEKTTESIRGFSAALKKIDFDPESLRLSVLGDEFDRAKEAFLEANKALNSARDIGIEEDGKRRVATEKELAELAKNRFEKQLEIERLRRDTLKDIEKTAADLNIRSLENTGKEVEAIKKRHSIELKEFNARIASMEKIAKLTNDELIAVNKVRAAMAESTKLEIKRAEAEQAEKRKKELEKIRDEYEKHLKTIQDLAGELRKIKREGLESSEQVAALAQLDLETRLEELSLLEKRLLLQERFSEKGTDGAYKLKAQYQEIFDVARKIAQQKFEEASPFTVANLVDTLKAGFDKAKVFAADLFSGNLFKNIDFASLSNLGEAIKKAFLDIDLKKVGAMLADGLIAGAELIGKLFDPAVINGLANSVTDMAKLPNELGKAFNNLVSSLDRFLVAFPEAAAKIIEALPGLIQRVLDRLPEFIAKLADAFVMLLDKLPHLIARIMDALPGIIAAIMRQLPQIILSAFESLGLIIGQVIKKLPEAFVEILEYADEFVAAFVEGFIASMGDIVVAFVDFLIGGGLEKIVAAILRAIPRIAGALVSGFLKGIQRAMGSIFGGIQLPEELTELPNQFAEGVQKLASRTTEEASKLFKVLDLEAEARGLEQANKIQDILNQGILAFEIKFKGLIDWLLEAWRKIVEWVKGVFEWVINGIKNVFQWVVDNVLTPLANVIRTAFQWVIDNVINPLINGITNAWKAIKKDILDPLLNGLKDVFSYLKTKVLDPFMTAFGTVINFLKDKVFDPFMTAFSKALDPDNFVKIGDKIWQGLKKGLETVGTVIQNALNVINPANLFEKIFKLDMGGTGIVENTLKIDVPFAKFAKGGMVPGQAVVGGDSLLNDRVLALLSPGEAVIPRSKMDDPRVNSIVNAILRGELLPSTFAKGGLVGTLQSIGGGLLSTLSGAVSGVLGSAAGPIVQALSPESFGRLATAIEGGFDPRKAGIGEIGTIVGSFADARKVMDALGTTVSGIGKGALDSITSTVELAKKGADNALQAIEQLKYLLSPQDMWALVKEKVFSSIIKMFEANRFHSGGLVPGFAFGGEVPAMLQPGEFVLNKGAVQNLGLGTLSNLNRGMMSGEQEFNFDITMNIKAEGVPDESFIRQRLVPTLKKELKEASLRGEFIMSNKGIRST